jgi:hypothetical protein
MVPGGKGEYVEDGRVDTGGGRRPEVVDGEWYIQFFYSPKSHLAE